MDIIGHEVPRTFLEKVTSAGNLSHAYLFVGPSSVGKMTVIESFVRELLEMGSEGVFHHPDLLVVSQAVNEKTGKLKKHIDTDQIRQLSSFLATRHVKGIYKIGIIDHAEKMNGNAANALLKTLEEPRGQAIIFLTVSDESLLPATICSRAQTLYFGRVSDEVMLDGLLSRGVREGQAQQIVSFAGGLPGKALSWIADPTTLEQYIEAGEMFRSLFGKPFFEKLHLVEPLFGDKTNHIETREELIHVLDIWLVQLREMMYTTEASVDKALSPAGFLEVMSAIDDAKHRLRQNVHPRLLIEHILLLLP